MDVSITGATAPSAKEVRSGNASESGGKATGTTNAGPALVDRWEPSGQSTPVDPTQGASGKQGFDLETFKEEMKRQLLEQVRKSKEQLEKEGIRIPWSSDIPYAVEPDQEAAAVPEEWGADKTSQRIVDFALAFRGNASGLSDEEFIDSIRKAIQEGFRSAKSDLKELPGPSAKLFNDTYDAAMRKLDDTLEGWKKAKADPSESAAPASAGQTTTNNALGAYAAQRGATSTPSPEGPGFSQVA